MLLGLKVSVHKVATSPHTLHVLQPLDLSIFSPLKGYRKAINNLSLLTDYTPVGKRNFLKYYYKAQQKSLTSCNIQSGWKATGLWPQNIAKLFISRLLLENSNNIKATTLYNSNQKGRLEWSETTSFVPQETPKGGRDVQIQADELADLNDLDKPTRRQLF